MDPDGHTLYTTLSLFLIVTDAILLSSRFDLCLLFRKGLQVRISLFDLDVLRKANMLLSISIQLLFRAFL